MKSMYVLYDRLMRLGMPFADARAKCQEAASQCRDNGGRFLVPVYGGWVFGTLTNVGVILGQ